MTRVADFEVPSDLRHNRGPIQDPAAFAREFDAASWLYLCGEEFAAMEERYKFVSAQLEDVKATRRDLLTVVKDVDERILDDPHRRAPILSTPGVIGIVGTTTELLPVSEEEIEAVRRVAREGMPAMPECEAWLAVAPQPGRKAVELLDAFLVHRLRT